MKKRQSAVSLSSIRERIRRVDQEISDLDDRRRELMVKRAVLAELLEVGKPTDNSNGKHVQPGEGPKAAILRVVGAEPGLKPADVVARIESTVRTGAKDRRKNLFQTVLNLKNKNVLKATPEGGLEIVRPATN